MSLTAYGFRVMSSINSAFDNHRLALMGYFASNFKAKASIM